MQSQTYSFNGVKVNFDKEEWLASSANYTREEMPQIDMTAFEANLSSISNSVKISTEYLSVDKLLPTQNEINFSNVLMNAASLKRLTDDQLVFICSKDLHIVDGHHRLVQQLIVYPERQVKCYVVDLDIHDLLIVIRKIDEILTSSKDIKGNVLEQFETFVESFGVQGPEAVPGMGAVDMGTPATSEETGTRGSGDIPGTIAKKKKFIDESDELVAMSKGQTSGIITSSYLKNLAKTSNIDWDERLKALRVRRGEDPETGEILDELTGEKTGRFAIDEEDDDCFDDKYRKDITSIVHEVIIESMGDISPEEWVEISQSKEKNPTNTLELNTVIEALANDKNSSHLKHAKHFENTDGLELLTCINKPVQRKFIFIDEPFSCKTLEGITQGSAGDALILSVDNEIYPCKREIFDATYCVIDDLEQSIE